MTTSPPQVAVIGGGICGLAAAHRLARHGVPVTLLEASDQLGGLGTFFSHRDQWVERFYHCVMPTDDELLGLLDELGMKNSVRWCKTTMGMIVDGRRHRFNSAVDLLRFTPLPFHDRVRFGAVSLLLRRLGRGRDLDTLRTEDWLRGLYGSRVWEELLGPMFGSKFGSSFGDVPALYLWQRLGRERNVATRGYPEGGYKAIIDALRTSIEEAGGTVRTSTPVRSLRSTATGSSLTLADGEVLDVQKVISTVPIPLLRQLADAGLAALLPSLELPYQGVVTGAFFLRRPLTGHYWTPVLRSNTGFDGIVEMSALSGAEAHGGSHLVYVMRYTEHTSRLYRGDDDEISARWTTQLLDLFPELEPGDVEEVRVFKAPFVEPIHPLGYLARRPPVAVAGTGLLLATTAHVYPDVTSWNSSVKLVNSVTRGVLEEIGRHEVAEPVP
ncbi:FAD-dependent oxidoreductase [Amycolatopsis regifaucium]|uniref:Oxidoreductase n=1 Tax=Amycolatopsis regifaucium TaxID=546365 RepID=A0A154M913_9PSEU|nr:FAD-dependent oxidoreductase [Amycolatopsis regifaucium]KZB81062.1 oxidoreductase [Amycolatopsis regifaucium]OKA04786.1 oxidoreductase [Amycolatopsis regifaucium]